MPGKRRDRVVWSKPVVFLACVVPLAILAWDAFHGTLGTDPVAQLEHRSGDWALRFLLGTLAITPLRRLTHQAWLLRYRRMLGLFAFFYASVHLAIYLGIDLGGYWSQIFADIAKKPFITVGFLAWLLMIPLAATSTHAMQRRLGRNWQRLHRLVYIAALLGVLHFLWQVKYGRTIAVREPVIYLAVFVALIAARVPAWSRQWQSRRAKRKDVMATTTAGRQ